MNSGNDDITAHEDPLSYDAFLEQNVKAVDDSIEEFLQIATRLTIDDLSVLASYPSQPHPLIYTIFVCMHCLLLSLAPQHHQIALEVLPWSVLRLELLINTHEIWTKLWKRLRRLQKHGAKQRLAPVQLHFVCQQLQPLHAQYLSQQQQQNVSLSPTEHSKYSNYPPILMMYARVSTIATGLAAWVYICLYFAVTRSGISSGKYYRVAVKSRQYLPELPQLLQQQATSQPPSTSKECAQQLRPTSPVYLTPITALTSLPGYDPSSGLRTEQYKSIRTGLKIGGRYFLFQAHIRSDHVCVISSSTHSPLSPLLQENGMWAVLRFDTNTHAASSRRKQVLVQTIDKSTAAPVVPCMWRSMHPITLSPSTKLLTLLHQIPPLAQMTLLFQMGYHAHVFEFHRPFDSILPLLPSKLEVPHNQMQSIVLKLAIVTLKKRTKQLTLLAIGNAVVPVEMSIATFRGHVRFHINPYLEEVSCSNAKHQESQTSCFDFLYRGGFLLHSHEHFQPVAALMPFALICIQSSKMKANSKTKILPSELWKFHQQLSQAIRNAGVLDHLPSSILSDSVTEAGDHPSVDLFSMHQSVEPTTAPIVSDFLVHWTTFVRFQQLQDSEVILQLNTKAKTRPRAKICFDESEIKRSTPHSENIPLLPHKRFHPTKEYLKPLYATANVETSTSAILVTPFRSEIMEALTADSRTRLVLSNASIVIHVTSFFAHDDDGNKIAINFQRDVSCPDGALLGLNGAYVWQICPLQFRHSTSSGSSPLVAPSPWLRDVFHFVTHPIWDFRSSLSQFDFFRVPIAYSQAEVVIEEMFWSKSVDWMPLLCSTDMCDSMLRKKYESMCQSHPPSFSIDSVKFSKFLRECGIQPKYLNVGDVAFLFARHMARGSHYEMIFDGFVEALDWIAHQLYDKRRSSKHRSHVHHSSSSSYSLPLTQMMFEILIQAPSMLSFWKDIIEFWRLDRKMHFLKAYCRQFSAATRIQATWKGFHIQQIYHETLQRLALERISAIKIQSTERMRHQYAQYKQLRHMTKRIQLRIKARSELRHLRDEHRTYMERMRLRVVKWMRQRLRVLRAWKELNALYIARRDRIREKKQRLLGVAVFPLETRRYRFSLYRAKHANDDATITPSKCPEPEDVNENSPSDEPVCELEVLESSTSWWQVLPLYQTLIDTFLVDEQERMAVSSHLHGCRSMVSPLSDETTPSCMTNPSSQEGRPKDALMAVVARLRLMFDRNLHTPMFKYYKSPIETSVGKLIFKGVVRTCTQSQGPSQRQWHAVKVLQCLSVFKIIMYTPSTSQKQRWDLSASFLYRILQFSRFQDLTLSNSPEDGHYHRSPLEVCKSEQQITWNLLRILRSAQHLTAYRHILSYICQFGTKTPEYEMMPHVIAAKAHQRLLKDAHELEIRRAYEHKYIVRVQARLRQRLAQQYRLRLALAAYTKQFDHARGKFVYINSRSSVPLIYAQKPWSLFDHDVSLPPDEWQLVLPFEIHLSNKRYFNPCRGVFNRFNYEEAATFIQNWFRRKMWIGIAQWDLCRLSQALRYHESLPAPTDLMAPDQLDRIKHRAFQLHILDHIYKAALAMYETALRIAPQDIQTLGGMAVLLIYSCRYPAKQMWSRALSILADAKITDAQNQPIFDEIEQNYFCWAMLLQPKNANMIGNYAVFLQCIRHEFDKAEVLYRRAIDIDPSNELILENYRRLERERAPDGIYAFSGPGKVARWRAKEIDRIGSNWRVMSDMAAPTPSTQRFFCNLQTGKCVWHLSEQKEEND